MNNASKIMYSLLRDFYLITRGVAQKHPPEDLHKKTLLLKNSQSSQEITCGIVFLRKLQASANNFTKKEILAQVLFCKFWEIFNNTFFKELLRWMLPIVDWDEKSLALNFSICFRFILCEKCPNTDRKKTPYLDTFHAVL